MKNLTLQKINCKGCTELEENFPQMFVERDEPDSDNCVCYECCTKLTKNPLKIKLVIVVRKKPSKNYIMLYCDNCNFKFYVEKKAYFAFLDNDGFFYEDNIICPHCNRPDKIVFKKEIKTCKIK